MAMNESNAPTSSCWHASRASDEVNRARSFLKAQSDLVRKEKRPAISAACDCPGIDPAEAAAWVDFSLALLNCNEFLYVP